MYVIQFLRHMSIIITSEKLIEEIQEEFTHMFPFLKIEFFSKTIIKSKEAINKISNRLNFGYADNIGNLKKIVISPLMTVKDFEKDVEKKFGMYMQLYRRSANLWLEVTITDAWTIKQQDEIACEINIFINRHQV